MFWIGQIGFETKFHCCLYHHPPQLFVVSFTIKNYACSISHVLSGSVCIGNKYDKICSLKFLVPTITTFLVTAVAALVQAYINFTCY